MSAVGVVLGWLLGLYLLVLLARLVWEWVTTLSSFRATGALIPVLEVVYTVTDPPLKMIRRFLPPLRFGNFALDLAFLVLFIVVVVLRAQVVKL
jgi:YggT family protein